MKRILLIDDDPDVQTLLMATLQQQGFEVETASQREEARQKIKETLPSLILLDVLLSGSDGRDLCREIKALPGTKDIPVIMFSGHPSAGLQYQRYGADDFLAKPVSTKALLDKLHQHLAIEPVNDPE